MRRAAFALLLPGLLLAATASTTAADAPRPHIVIFIADDLGWSDVGYHGSEIKTPNLDRLAASGVRLEQFYVQPVCSPTRSSLMTGRYPIRQGLQVGVIRPWADYGLPLEERTLSVALKEVGYKTAITGKWHLGLHEPAYLPTRRGFDLQYGHYCGALDYFTHRRDGGLDWHRNDKVLEEEGYTTTLIGNEAARIVAEHDPKQPLFLYVPFNAPHSPLQAPQEYLDRYADIKDKKRRPYAAMVTCMDDAIGRVVEALDDRGMTKDTLILFSSDNGGPTSLGATNGPLRGGKGSLYEGGVRVPAFAAWPGKLKAGSETKAMMHIVDWYPTLLTLAGATLDQVLPLDGKNAWPAIAEGSPSPRSEILHNLTPTSGAIRVGDWKLVTGGGRRNQANAKTELFNIADDPNEKNDLADAQPEKVKQLQARMAVYRKEAVAPKGGAGPKPADFKTPKVWGQPD